MGLLRIPPLRAGLTGLFSQNLILMGVFFVVPLYLQLVLGLDALQTGVKMLPISITMFLAAAAGSRLSTRFTVRGIVQNRARHHGARGADPACQSRTGPEGRRVRRVDGDPRCGDGLIASQLGNVVQSSVDASGRGEAGGLQYTVAAARLLSLGVALIGAIVLTGLTSGFVTTIQSDQRISAEVSAQVGVAVEGGLDFVSADQVQAAAQKAGLDPATTAALVEDYSRPSSARSRSVWIGRGPAGPNCAPVRSRVGRSTGRTPAKSGTDVRVRRSRCKVSRRRALNAAGCGCRGGERR